MTAYSISTLGSWSAGAILTARTRRPLLSAFGGPQSPRRNQSPRRATLLNLSPWQSWVHLYCQEAAQACQVTFACNGMEGEPVTWTLDLEPKTAFSYWPGRTSGEGTSSNLEAALIHAGKTESEARRRTTCEVSSAERLAVRGYTRFSGDPALIPVAVYVSTALVGSNPTPSAPTRFPANGNPIQDGPGTCLKTSRISRLEPLRHGSTGSPTQLGDQPAELALC